MSADLKQLRVGRLARR